MTLRSLVGKIYQFIRGFWKNNRIALFRQKYLRRRLIEKYKVPISEVMVERALHELREEGLLMTIMHGRKGCQFLRPGDPIPKRLSIFLSHDEGDCDGQNDGVSVAPSLCEATPDRIERKQPALQTESVPPPTYQDQTEEGYIAHRLECRRNAIAAAYNPAAYVKKLREIFRADFFAMLKKAPTRMEKEKRINWMEYPKPYQAFEQAARA